MIANSYFDSLCRDDICNVDKVKRDEQGTRLLLRSYARNISTFASNKTILKDINANFPMSDTTFYDYLKTLQEMQAPLRLPDLKIILTGTPYGYKREDGVFVIPIGCLKD